MYGLNCLLDSFGLTIALMDNSLTLTVPVAFLLSSEHLKKKKM